LAVVAIGTIAGSAQAQSGGLALDRLDPAPAGDRMFGVPSPYADGELTPHLMLLGDYAHNPLILRSTSSDQSLGAVVSSQLLLHLDGSLSLFSRLNVNIDVPVAVYQDGDSPNVGQVFGSPSQVQPGDFRLGVRLRIFGEYFDPFQVAIGGYLWLPTGPSRSYVGTGQVRGLPQLIVGGRLDRFLWTAAAGPDIQSSATYAGLDQGTMFTWGAGFGVLLLDNRHLQIGAESYGAITVNDVVNHTTNIELLGDVRYRIIDDFEIGVGAGPGLTTGIGTPDVRAIAMLAYAPEQKPDRDRDGVRDPDDACPDVPGPKSSDPQKNGCPPPPPPPDRDRDGIVDADDACPDEPGVSDSDPKKNGCPKPKDRDGDGVSDKDDACPDEPGVSNTDPKKNGCPKPTDRDEDGIPDVEDACPDVKGVHTRDPATNGCPPDTDGDGIPDDKDACPAEKGIADPDPTKNGCPKAVRVTEKEIIILEQVQFDTGKATIKKASDSLLDQVAAVLAEHPEILRVEVQGHTDSRGSPAFNKALSQQRADAVDKALVERGIDRTRITAKGYGQELPMADNVTDEGRQKNRRVEFKILEKRAREKP
jgi:outer membrane protein OmpA-like peptidoglycan-associated protein